MITKCSFQMPFFSSTLTKCNAKDCGISKAAKDESMLPAKNQLDEGISGDRK